VNIKELSFLLKNISILYVEDDLNTQEQMSQVLSSITNNLIVATTGIEALNLYYEKKPDLIISDIDMPDFNGIAFIKEVRKNDLKTPIILLTAYNNVEYLLPAANLNIQSYIIKPISSKVLRETLHHIAEILNLQSCIYIEISDSLKYNKINSEFICDEGTKIQLNKKEKDLINLLLLNKNRVVSYSEIEQNVWMAYDEVMTNMALRTVIKNIRKKIPLDFIKNISGQGYKLIF